jgi:hypothetical protein
VAYISEGGARSMSEPFVAGLFGCGGILLGGFIQFWFSRRTEREARYMELKLNAYVDYVNTVAQIAFSTPAERTKVLDQLAASKTRICVFGDKEVVEAAAKLEESSRDLAMVDAQLAFTHLCQVMRKRGIAGGNVTDEDISTLLFAPKESQRVKSVEPRGGSQPRT